MNREITMESVFFSGFKAAWQDGPDDHGAAPEGQNYFDKRNQAWQNYVKELDAGN